MSATESQHHFPIIEVPADAVGETEPMGTKRKFWYPDPTLGLCLFKYSRPDAGEDWAEKVTEQLCILLGLPHARYELAEFMGHRGVISPIFVGVGEELVPGNRLLVARDPTYPAQADRARVKVPQHTVAAIAEVLASAPTIDLPPGITYPSGVRSAWDVFTGYLLLDALIGNTDRHHENWAVVNSSPFGRAARWLAPTHDHGSCLGRNEREERVRERLATTDLNQTPEAYADRCRSKLYAGSTITKPLRSVDAFAAAARLSPTAAEAWLSRLDKLPSEEMRAIFERIPTERITSSVTEFALRIVTHNRSRLLALRGSFA